jgi:phosphatidylserine/phosphatidylglycerophosphate/cardiolipin synthase-like enzyme
MIRRIQDAARRGVRVRLFVPADANNWACAAAQQFHHAALLEAGVRILEYPRMLHAKAFVPTVRSSLPARATSRPGA